MTSLKDPVSSHSEVREALSLLTRAVSENSPRAKTLLASMHREGIGVKQDYSAALRLFCDAAVAGDPIAQCSLGVLQLELIDKKEKEHFANSVKSTDFAVDVDDKGEIRGRIELEMKDGQSVTDAPKPADLVRRIRKARRKAGFTDEQSKEFEDFKEKERIRKLSEEKEIALSWLDKAISQGNDVAMNALACEVLEKDPKRAQELYELAIKTSRNTDAYFNLGQLLARGKEGVPQDQKGALKNFAMAAQLGDASAQYYLGHLYRVGSHEVNVDQASARQYIELAAEQGHPAALYYLALMHLNGEGGLEVSEGAFRRYAKIAAEAEHGPAHLFLGNMYYKGTEGAEIDYKKAFNHFLAAGRLGEGDGYCSAAAMYFHGIGVAEDHHEAFLLYQEAAQLGSTHALRSIGSMYYHGHGTPANKKIAEYFIHIADESEAEEKKAGNEHMGTAVETTEAPRHPMMDVPRVAVQEESFEDITMESSSSEHISASTQREQAASPPPKE